MHTERRDSIIVAAATGACSGFIKRRPWMLRHAKDVKQEAAVGALKALGSVDWTMPDPRIVNYLKMHADWHLRNTYTKAKSDPLQLHAGVEEMLTAPDSVAQADARIELEQRFRGATREEIAAAGQIALGTRDTGSARRARAEVRSRGARLKARRQELTREGRCWDCRAPQRPERVGMTRCVACAIKGKRSRQQSDVGNLSTRV